MKLMQFSENLKAIRHQRQLTQTAVADKLHVSRQTVSSWENERSYPDIMMLVQISDVYSITLDDLLKGDLKLLKAYENEALISRRNQRILQLTIYLNAGLLFLTYLSYFLKWPLMGPCLLALVINLVTLATHYHAKTYHWLRDGLTFGLLLILNTAMTWPLSIHLPLHQSVSYTTGMLVGEYTGNAIWIISLSISALVALFVRSTSKV